MPLYGISIYLDPGHGGVDIGTSYKELYEKDINLDVTYYIKNVLEKKGASVYLTRYGDYDVAKPNYTRRKLSDLSNRVKMINNLKPNLYISIHTNYFTDSNYNGIQIFYTEKNKNNNLLCNTIKEELKIKRKCMIIKDMYMYDNINVPGVLIEIGFISNSKDRYLMQNEDYKLEISNKISNGIVNYINYGK